MPKAQRIINLTLSDEKATENFAKLFANNIIKGDIILLEGDLGAGKSVLARAIIRQLLNDEKLEVPSPTFALIQPYQTKYINILHVDLYRIKDSFEVEELGLYEDENAILLVEWAQRDKDLVKQANWKIKILMGNSVSERIINIFNYDNEQRLKKLQQALK